MHRLAPIIVGLVLLSPAWASEQGAGSEPARELFKEYDLIFIFGECESVGAAVSPDGTTNSDCDPISG